MAFCFDKVYLILQRGLVEERSISEVPKDSDDGDDDATNYGINNDLEASLSFDESYEQF